jgi:hypothetical protein
MVKVADMLSGYGVPQGELGRSIDHDTALRIATECRRIMGLDLEELDLATQVQLFNAEVDAEQMGAAWELLNSGERAAWRNLLNYNEWRRNQEMKSGRD